MQSIIVLFVALLAVTMAFNAGELLELAMMLLRGGIGFHSKHVGCLDIASVWCI